MFTTLERGLNELSDGRVNPTQVILPVLLVFCLGFAGVILYLTMAMKDSASSSVVNRGPLPLLL
jgi:hypothetical protein